MNHQKEYPCDTNCIKVMEKAKALGFADAAVMDVSDLVIDPTFRTYCEANVCGNYNLLPACPPKCGSIEEMTTKLKKYQRALILQTEEPYEDLSLEACKKAQAIHNLFAERLMSEIKDDLGNDLLFLASGPWKTHSCLSAYCVDAQKMAEAVGMKCWDDAAIMRLFSLILFDPK